MTRPKCAPCLSAEVRALIVEAFPSLAASLQPVPVCDGPQLVEFCTKRKSAYQAFTSACMKEKAAGQGFSPAIMRECAAAWRAKKAEGVKS